MALRQTTGFVESLLHLPIDSTAIKVEGEGEWNARRQGGQKRRVWRKIHIGIDAQTLDVRAVDLTSHSVGGAPMLSEGRNPVPSDQEMASVTADGAYDTRKCHDAIAERGACACHSCPQECEALQDNRPRCLSPATRRYGLQNTWAVRYGDDGAETAAKATSKFEPGQKTVRGLFSGRMNAMSEATGAAPYGAGLRPSGCRVPGSCRGAERLHRPRHRHHEGRGIALSGRRDSLDVRRFLRQSRPEPPNRAVCGKRRPCALPFPLCL